MTLRRLNSRRWAAAAVLAAACWSATVARADLTIKGKNGMVQLTLPDGWARDEPDGPLAEVSATNDRLDCGAAVLAEDRTGANVSAADYAKIILDQFKSSGVFADTSTTPLVACKVGGRPAARCDFKATVKGVKLGYVITVIQGEHDFETVETWTTQAALERRRAVLEKVADGVKETTPPAGAAAGGGGPPVTLTGKDHVCQVTLPAGFVAVPLPAGAVGGLQLLATHNRTGASFLVIREPRADPALSLDAYGRRVLAAMAANKANHDVTHTAFKPLKVDGRDALRCQLDSTTNDAKMTWLLTVVRTDTAFYQVNAYCLQSKFAANQAVMSALADGFHETVGK